ncbi:hypothetical protein ACFFUP_13830 [Vibrio ostreicida]|uniref:Uncharacterized protein n=1 Tax=Vibrio ostreicida TaxID=526588 RepID=A0ABT8C0Q6_9VIBR|nr:hypothetical protein [Vibrio ostreicida]MDN3612239.1 hypothetical protein [Vibrio ostreicida]NPD08628.1 hypothetical protein [Vibrio ostreicida]
MTEKTIDNINRILAKANLAPVTLPTLDILHALSIILWDRQVSQELNYERVRVLIKAGIYTELDILNECNDNVDRMHKAYEYCPLVKLLSPLNRDGTLYLSGAETICNLSWDIHLFYIKNIISLGGRIDHNEFIVQVFNDNKSAFDTFNYLIEHFQFEPLSINKSASNLVINHYFKKYKKEEKGRAAFEKLIEKGININLAFEEGDGLSDYHSFLGVLFCHEPDVFEQYLLIQPNQPIIVNLPWNYSIKKAYFNKKQTKLVKKLISLGYQLPLDQIIETLETFELFDYAKALAN